MNSNGLTASALCAVRDLRIPYKFILHSELDEMTPPVPEKFGYGRLLIKRCLIKMRYLRSFNQLSGNLTYLRALSTIVSTTAIILRLARKPFYPVG